MAFVIETSPQLPFIHTRMIDPVQKSEAKLIQKQLREILAGRCKHSCLYIGLNLAGVLMQEEVPLVKMIGLLAEIYHESRYDYQLELLVVIEPTLVPIVRYIAESLVVPMLFFASYETLNTYVRRRNEGTQPLSPKLAYAGATDVL
jgi:hypothetical protein